MRFVQKWSYACANHFATVLNENHQKRAVYYYGFFIIIGAMVKGIILISAALLFGTLLPTIFVFLAFASLRIGAGGYHMDTYGKCLFASLVLYITASLITQHTYKFWNDFHIAMLITITFVTGLYVLIRYAPKDTPNKPITKPEQIMKYKKLSIIILFVWFIISIALTIFKQSMYIIALNLGILLELFSVTPTGHKFFDKINNGLNKKAIHNM
mgnify:CR=1 FL=1